MKVGNSLPTKNVALVTRKKTVTRIAGNTDFISS
jgi:hypothetical protein